MAQIAKDGEVERLKVEISELHKSKCQSLELIEQRDIEIREKDGVIKSYYDKIVSSLNDLSLPVVIRSNREAGCTASSEYTLSP
jgi:hypothetical protein